MIRLIVAFIVTAVLVIATVISLLAKPLNAADTIGPIIICEPKLMTDELAKVRKGRISKT